MNRNGKLFAAAAACAFSLTALFGAALAATGSWSGSGPLAPDPSGVQIHALAVSPYGERIYCGASSGTVFSYAFYPTLRVAKGGEGSGTVNSVPPGTDCGPGCRYYDVGASVTFTGIPAEGSRFIGWNAESGCSSIPSCTVALSDDIDVTANFRLRSTPQGDVNAVDGVTLADVILALQILAGMSTEGKTVTLDAEVSNSGRIGLAEAVYILQKVGDAR